MKFQPQTSILLSLIAVVSASRSMSNRSPHHVQFVRGTDESKYPPIDVHPPRSMTPQTWIDALEKAQNEGKIPKIGQSVVDVNGEISYPKSAGSSHEICSWTVHKCLAPEDVINPPEDILAVSFDDGPTPFSDDLYSFLKTNNQAATHFMIGSQILTHIDQFKNAVSTGLQQFAVHTWSHSLQTSLTDEQVVAELGWTMQIIYDYSGKIPNLWRPPQGDVDSRVRAIATEVFGLKTVLWNEDSNDWCIQEDGTSACPNETPGLNDQSIGDAIQSFIHKTDRSQGLMILEHELSTSSVNHFKNYYPQLAGLGWTPTSVADMDGSDWYSNSINATSPVSTQTDMPASFQITSLPGANIKGIFSSSAKSTNLTTPLKEQGMKIVSNANDAQSLQMLSSMNIFLVCLSFAISILSNI